MQASRGGVWLGAVWLGNAGMARHDWAWRVPAWWGVVMQATHNKRISMSSKYNRVKAELDKLAVDGKLTAQAVVDAAREESSPLHGYFEWDDNKAANEYRLLQARKLIRVVVQPCEPLDNQPMHVYQSLVTDRVVPGGGYRTTEAILSTEAWRNTLLEQAKRELVGVRNKYASLTELAKVWTAIDTVTPKLIEHVTEYAQLEIAR
jgi:hypothetical protein